MAASRVQTAVGAHLVGGLAAPDAETAMRTTARILGRHLHGLTDGETGVRSQWIWWQLDKLAAIDGIERAGMHGFEDADNEDYQAFPQVTVADSVTSLPARSLGYADAAEESYGVFKALREEGVIEDGVRFQVCVPTPYATVVAWVAQDDQERFFPIYADAIEAEVAEIARVVDPSELALQFDVAVEIGALTGNFAYAGDLGTKDFVNNALRDVFTRVPDGVEAGIHLCYGDYKHRHFTVPEDLSLCVELANAVTELAAFVHMPADRETGRNPAYFEPLSDLKTTHTLALGVIDYEGSSERTAELVQAAAEGGGREFAVATECGMARIDERGGDGPSLERLLELHAEFAAPVR